MPSVPQHDVARDRKPYSAVIRPCKQLRIHTRPITQSFAEIGVSAESPEGRNRKHGRGILEEVLNSRMRVLRQSQLRDVRVSFGIVVSEYLNPTSEEVTPRQPQ
jgi:hypothetical protein